jgi:2-dehydro-3-deoxygluconokinase
MRREVIQIKAPATSHYDVLALGEVMLRLDPGEDRIRSARQFKVWEGGGEYNVARGLRRCFGLRAAVATALADNEVGHLIESLIMAGGVDMALSWFPCDALGRSVRNGLNFTERGFGLRGAASVPDRGRSAASQLKIGDIDWDHLFGELGVRWFHTGGIFAGLSDSTAEVIMEAGRAARRHGTVVSYDLNYRPSLWREYGGAKRAQAVNQAIAPYVDVIIGNEGHFDACLGIRAPQSADIDSGQLRATITEVKRQFPNMRVVAATRRVDTTASHVDWSAVAWSADDGFVESSRHVNIDVLDRIGAGDGFAAGLIYGLLNGSSLRNSMEYGVAHGALVMTTPGDTSVATLQEVEALMADPSAQIKR